MPAKRPRGRPPGAQHDDIVYFRCEANLKKGLQKLAKADDRLLGAYVRKVLKDHLSSMKKAFAIAIFCLLAPSANADDMTNALYASCVKGSRQPMSEKVAKACVCMAQKLAADQRLSNNTKQQLAADLRYDPSKDPARATDQTKIQGLNANAYETLAKTEDILGCAEDKNGRSVRSQIDDQFKK